MRINFLILLNLQIRPNIRVGSCRRDGWDSGTNLGRRDTPRPIFRGTSRPVQESARPIQGRDEKSGRHTRT